MNPTEKSISINSLARIQRAWKHAPHELLSLWDMIEYPTCEIRRAVQALKDRADDGRLGLTEDIDAVMESILVSLAVIHGQSVTFGLSLTENHCEKLKLKLEIYLNLSKNKCDPKLVVSRLPSPKSVAEMCTDIISAFQKELEARKLAFIPLERIKFFETENLFGADFHAKASKAINLECKAAGNCLAADLNTAAVFHLMRVAERGMHALANHLLPNQNIKPYPLEFSDWHKVVDAIEAALDSGVTKSVNLTPGATKDRELEFYRGLVADLNYFKDAFRNPVSHLRGNHDFISAQAVLGKVKEFMVRLSDKVPLN